MFTLSHKLCQLDGDRMGDGKIAFRRHDLTDKLTHSDRPALLQQLFSPRYPLIDDLLPFYILFDFQPCVSFVLLIPFYLDNIILPEQLEIMTRRIKELCLFIYEAFSGKTIMEADFFIPHFG